MKVKFYTGNIIPGKRLEKALINDLVTLFEPKNDVYICIKYSFQKKNGLS